MLVDLPNEVEAFPPKPRTETPPPPSVLLDELLMVSLCEEAADIMLTSDI